MIHPRIRLVAALAILGASAIAPCAIACTGGLVSVPVGRAGAAPESSCVTIVPIGVVPPEGDGFVRGRVYVLEGGAGARGNYGLLDLPRCDLGMCLGSQDDLGCQLANGYLCTLHDEWLKTAPGLHAGLVRSAVEERFARDSDRREGIPYADYLGRGGNDSRLVVVPLTTAPDNGRDFVRLTGYAAFFLRDIPRDGGHDTLDAEFISYIVIGEGQ